MIGFFAFFILAEPLHSMMSLNNELLKIHSPEHKYWSLEKLWRDNSVSSALACS